MTLVVTNSGTYSSSVGTEQDLVTLTGPKTFTLTIDTVNLVFGSTNDELQIKIKTKALTGGTERTVYSAYFVGAQDTPIKVSIPVPVPFTATVRINQTFGTSRNFDWNITTPDV